MDEDKHKSCKREERGQKSHPKYDCQRLCREIEYAVECETNQSGKRILASPRESCLTLVWERYLPETYPGAHAANEAVSLRQGIDNLDHLAIHQTEIAAVDWNFGFCEHSQHAVECEIARPHNGGLLPAITHPVDDIGAVTPAL